MSAGTGTVFAAALKGGGRGIAVVVCLGLGACAQLGPLADQGTPSDTASVTTSAAATGDQKAELAKAVAYWGQEHQKAPRELKPALAYARNLKAAGEKDRALAVLQRAAMYHSQDRELLSEYGRLALDLDQIGLAQKALELADDPGKPDWRVVSARGTVLAKQGSYSDAIPYYERALQLAPEQPSVLNNLAMALTANGQADQAESLLKRAMAKGGTDPKLRRNLALVLGLQGKQDEARQLAALDQSAAATNGDLDALRKNVAQPKAVVAAGPIMPTPSSSRPAAAAQPAPAAQTVSNKEPALAAKPAVMGDAAADAIIQKAIAASAAAEVAKTARKDAPKPPQNALRGTSSDTTASSGTWSGAVAANSKPATAP